MKRSTQAFSLVELLVVIAILCLVAALMFPVYAQAKRRAMFASATVSLRQIGGALAMYQADHEGHIPIRNWGFMEAWEVYRKGDPTNDPLAPYGLRGYEPNGAIRQGDNPMNCPGEGHGYFYRWVFSITSDNDPREVPEEVRRIEPQPTSVLVRCPNLLTTGYRSGSFPTSFTEYSDAPQDREGRELLLRGDGSVSNVDTRTERFFYRRSIDGVDTWAEGNLPGTPPPGQMFEVFQGEAWPPEWTTIARPKEGRR